MSARWVAGWVVALTLVAAPAAARARQRAAIPGTDMVLILGPGGRCCRADYLWIADVATATVRARLACGHGRAGAAAIGRTLDALGFTTRVPTRALHEHDGKSNVIFRDQGLEVSLAGPIARLARAGRVVGEVRFDIPKDAEVPNAETSWVAPWAAPVPGAVIVGAGVAITEGCGAWEYDEVRRILLPPATPRRTSPP